MPRFKKEPGTGIGIDANGAFNLYVVRKGKQPGSEYLIIVTRRSNTLHF